MRVNLPSKILIVLLIWPSRFGCWCLQMRKSHLREKIQISVYAVNKYFNLLFKILKWLRFLIRPKRLPWQNIKMDKMRGNRAFLWKADSRKSDSSGLLETLHRTLATNQNVGADSFYMRGPANATDPLIITLASIRWRQRHRPDCVSQFLKHIDKMLVVIVF